MIGQSSLFVGHVWHKRFRPKVHAFRYRCFYFLLDLDELPELRQRLFLFSLNSFNLFSFYEADHADGKTGSLKAKIDERLKQIVPDWQGGRVLLLTMPRIIGYAFNPLSVYYCYDHAGRLKAILYEVNNTFGERHTYAVPLYNDKQNGIQRHNSDKRLYVSPFFDTAGSYRFANQLDEKAVKLSIDYRGSTGQQLLVASISAKRQQLTDASLFRAFVAFPFLTIKVIAAIHYEALKLWLKGISIKKRPAANKIKSVRTVQSSSVLPPEKSAM